jgi:hypothetical protein
VSKFIDMLFVDPLVLSQSTVDEIKLRAATDKKFEIRKCSIIGFAKIYSRYISSKLCPLNELDGNWSSSCWNKFINGDVLSRFDFFPGLIVKSWGNPDITSRHLIVQVRNIYCSFNIIISLFTFRYFKSIFYQSNFD